MASVLTTLLNELATTNNHNSSIENCKLIIKNIEEKLDKRVLFYFSSEVGKDNNSMVNDEDSFLIENLLSIPSTKKDLIFVLHSNGGFSNSAERVIDVCKNYCSKRKDGSKFIVVVPKRAKSAATIIALGADKIYLRSTAELGPVDPQFIVSDNKGATQMLPAYLVVDGIENLLPPKTKKSGLVSRMRSYFNNNNLSNLPTQIRLKLFEQNNYNLYINAKNELGLSESIISKILAEKSQLGLGIVEKDFDIFRDPHITKSHGRLINLSDLKDNNLCKGKIIEPIENLTETAKAPEIESLLWEFYVRRRQLLNDAGNNLVKTIETSQEFFVSIGSKLGQEQQPSTKRPNP